MQRNGDTRMRATHSFSACLSTSFLALLWLQLPTSFAPPASTVLLLLLCLILQVFSPSSLQPERTSFCRFCLQEPGSCMTRLESKRERDKFCKKEGREEAVVLLPLVSLLLLHELRSSSFFFVFLMYLKLAFKLFQLKEPERQEKKDFPSVSLLSLTQTFNTKD